MMLPGGAPGRLSPMTAPGSIFRKPGSQKRRPGSATMNGAAVKRYWSGAVLIASMNGCQTAEASPLSRPWNTIEMRSTLPLCITICSPQCGFISRVR